MAHVLGAAEGHGMGFGLAVVTIAEGSVQSVSPPTENGRPLWPDHLPPYHDRLAWIVVVAPDVMASCPAMTAPEPARPATTKRLPGYQILAIDADTGAAGILYTAKADALCGGSGYRPPTVRPAVEGVSESWTLVSRGPGPKAATISYQRRSCDEHDFGRFTGTGQPVVMPGQDHPDLVRVVHGRVLTTCGPATPTDVLLRSATLVTNLPRHLTHAPVGALDVAGDISD